jgi:hypothetical protein
MGATAVALGVLAVLSISLRPHGRRVEIDGYVYQECRGNELVGPIKSAEVSTSLDARSTTTGGDGYFKLVTDRRGPLDEFYVVTVAANGSVVSQRFMESRVTAEVTLSPPWQRNRDCRGRTH